MSVISHGETDIGKRRKINEDAIFAANNLFLVCDGMGGHKAGEVASRLAVETVARFVERTEEDRELTWPFGFNPRLSYNANRLRTAIKLANRAVHRQATSREEYTGMGTTVAAVLISPTEPRVTYANVGDSRVYLIRDRVMLQMSRDDSWANLGWSGGAAEDVTGTAAMKNILTKALGAREDVEFDVVDQALQEGDLVMLCSDGLTNMVPDPRINELVTAHANDPAGACRALITEANAQGGRDNISVILVEYRR